MLTTVIYAHPYEASFNKAILDTVIERLKRKNKEYALIDLYKEHFDPVLNTEELAVYAKGEHKDPLVGKYIETLDKTDEVVLIFPIWWYDFPAIMKGFFDKVMLVGSAFYKDDKGMHALRDIGKTLIITTASASTESLIHDLGDTINRMMIDTIFKAIGFNGAQWVNMGSIGNSTALERQDFLSRISMLV